MVFGMSIYNVALQTGFTSNLLIDVLKGFIPVLIIAVAIDLIIVGPIAKKIAFKLPFTLDTDLKKGLAISCCMVSGMVVCMSLFALLSHQMFEGNILVNYLTVLGLNALCAFPLQLILVGPISRKLLRTYQKSAN